MVYWKENPKKQFHLNFSYKAGMLILINLSVDPYQLDVGLYTFDVDRYQLYTDLDLDPAPDPI